MKRHALTGVIFATTAGGMMPLLYHIYKELYSIKMTPISVAAIMYALTLPHIPPFLAIGVSPLRVNLRQGWWIIVRSSLTYLAMIANNYAILHIPIGVAAIFTNLSGAISTLASFVLFKEKYTKLQIFSLFLAVFGASLIAEPVKLFQDGFEGADTKDQMLGICFALISAFCYSMASIVQRQYLTDLSSFTVVAGITLISTLISMTTSVALYAFDALLPNCDMRFLLVCTAILCSSNYIVYSASLRHISAGCAMTIEMSAYVVGSVLWDIADGVQFSAWVWSGFALTTISLAISLVKEVLEFRKSVAFKRSEIRNDLE